MKKKIREIIEVNGKINGSHKMCSNRCCAYEPWKFVMAKSKEMHVDVQKQPTKILLIFITVSRIVLQTKVREYEKNKETEETERVAISMRN